MKILKTDNNADVQLIRNLVISKISEKTLDNKKDFLMRVHEKTLFDPKKTANVIIQAYEQMNESDFQEFSTEIMKGDLTEVGKKIHDDYIVLEEEIRTQFDRKFTGFDPEKVLGTVNNHVGIDLITEFNEITVGSPIYFFKEPTWYADRETIGKKRGIILKKKNKEGKSRKIHSSFLNEETIKNKLTLANSRTRSATYPLKNIEEIACIWADKNGLKCERKRDDEYHGWTMKTIKLYDTKSDDLLKKHGYEFVGYDENYNSKRGIRWGKNVGDECIETYGEKCRLIWRNKKHGIYMLAGTRKKGERITDVQFNIPSGKMKEFWKLRERILELNPHVEEKEFFHRYNYETWT